uniref:Uncharacterized protein n=1 Tax=Strigops habroptila TaxID=2489341 RepID=A0A672U097_STRHB
KRLQPFTQRFKPRPPIPPSHIQLSSLLNSVVRLSLKLQVCLNWCTTSSSTNHLLRSNTSYHPLIHNHAIRKLHHKYSRYLTRAPIPNILILTTCNNMIYLNTS